MKQYDTEKNKHGFTLIELMVSVVIFGVIVGLIASVFVDALRLQRRAFNKQQLIENAGFALESMTKEIRVGVLTVFSDGCDQSSFSFVHPDNGSIEYYLSLGEIHRVEDGLDRPITDRSSVLFTNLSFCIMGSQSGDSVQPRITLNATLESAHPTAKVSADLQTTVSIRKLDQ